MRALALTLTFASGTQGEVLLPHLLTLLHNPDEQVRLQVVAMMTTFAKGGQHQACEGIIILLQDQLLSVRERASVALTTLQEPSARAALHQALADDENRPIRPAIFAALSHLGDRTIIAQLSAEFRQQREDKTRVLLLHALGAIEEAPTIRKRLLHYIQKDKDGALSCELIAALARADASVAGSTLMSLLRNLTTLPGRQTGHMLSWKGAEQAIIACIDALRDLRERQAIELFLELFERYKEAESLRREVTLHLVHALGLCSDDRALPPLLSYLTEHVICTKRDFRHLPSFIDWEMVEANNDGLSQIGHPEAVPALKQALRFRGEGLSLLQEEQRLAYQRFQIEEKIIGAIEHITRRSVDPHELDCWSWKYAETKTTLSSRKSAAC